MFSGTRATVIAVAAVAVGVVLIAWAALSLGVGRPAVPVAGGPSGPLPSSSIASRDGSGSPSPTGSLNATTTAVDIEVPVLVGKSVQVAEALAAGAGLTVQTRIADPAVPGVEPGIVVAQWPEAGALVHPGAEVVITYQAETADPGTQYVVVIDAGHQQKANLGLEPVGPGSTERKAKVAGGATGVATRLPEYELTLTISLKLRDVLVAKGVKVVMVRTTNTVNIPNSERATIGNDAKADLVVRIHLNGSTDNSVHGITTLYPAGNSWVAPITAASKKAAEAIHPAVIAATGALSQGIAGSSIMTGFNYSKRPTIIVECGYLSNAAEDRLVATESYQQKIADGIAAGIMTYLQGQ
jgi:N-acetylmuramoyl-L-alanine amidase